MEGTSEVGGEVGDLYPIAIANVWTASMQQIIPKATNEVGDSIGIHPWRSNTRRDTARGFTARLLLVLFL